MRRIDRRALFTSGAAAALLASAGVSAQAGPRSGGRLRLAVPRDGSLGRIVEGAVLETLTEISPDGALTGQLAESWRADQDARLWEFDLAGRVLLPDGTKFEAEHATASLAQVDGVQSVEASGAATLRISLGYSDPDLPLRLASLRHAISIDRSRLVGTGPYRSVRFDPDRGALLQKVSDHPRRGWAEQVEIAVIPDPAVRAEAVRDGFVDVAYLPQSECLKGGSDLVFHPSAKNLVIAATRDVGMPRTISTRSPLDDGRIARRWWMV